MTDPKQQALTKFAAAPDLTPFDVLMRYATDPPLAEKTLLDAIGEGLPPQPRIAELGPGSGWLLEDMIAAFPDAHLHALDMSAAMLTNIREQFGHRVAIVRGDIERLPYRDATFDVIATCWTLYFMNDIDAALEEIKRCVKPGGRVVAATVAADHMHEFDDMVAESVRDALGRERDPDIGERFNVENGEAYMRRRFGQVELREWGGEMRLPDVDRRRRARPRSLRPPRPVTDRSRRRVLPHPPRRRLCGARVAPRIQRATLMTRAVPTRRAPSSTENSVPARKKGRTRSATRRSNERLPSPPEPGAIGSSNSNSHMPNVCAPFGVCIRSHGR